MVRSQSLLRHLTLIALPLVLLLAACQGAAAPTVEPTDADPGETPAEQPEEPTPTQAAEPEHGFEDGDVITLITGTNPGGGFDFNLRTLQPYLEEELRNLTGLDLRVVVENVPGGGQRVGYETAARAEPDGTTMVLMSLPIATAHQILNDADYDMRELTHLGQLAVTNKGFMVRKDLELPERSLSGLIERSQEEPLLWGQAGAATDFVVMSELLRENGVELNVDEVIYDGTSEEIAGMLRGEIEVIWTTLSTLMREAEANPELEVIGTTACEREVSAPDVPTIVEEEVPGAEDICRLADGSPRVFVGPAGIPDGTQQVLIEALQRAIENEEHIQTALDGGVEITYAPPDRQEELVPQLIELYERYQDILEERQG